MPNDGVQRNNVVRNNCVSSAAHPGSLYGGYGLTIENSNIPAANGTFVDPKFTDPANADFLLQEDSPCLGKGPTDIQPLPIEPGACRFYAAAAGNDAAAGTLAAPFATVAHLASRLAPGQTGCLTGAEPLVGLGGLGVISSNGTEAQPIVIRSTGAGQGRLAGRYEITGSSVKLTDVEFLGVRSAAEADGTANYKGAMLTVTGTDVSIWNSSLTSPFGTCVLVGTAETPADRFSLRLSTVSGCGTSNTLTNADGGVHGVWLAYGDQAGVSESIITNNKTRGLQLWPHVTNSTIVQNLVYGNSGAVNVGWKDWAPYLWPANNSISHNIIGGSTFAFSKDTHEIYGFMPNDGVDRGNIVWSNCVVNQASPAALYGGNGLTIQNSNVPASNGRSVDPRFSDAANGNFKLRADSPCHQFGPMSIQYDGAPEPPVITRAPTLSGIARVGSTLTVSPGAWGPAPVTLTYQWHRLTAAGDELLPVTTSAYQATAADVNSRLRVTVTGSKAGYSPATASIESAVVQPGTLAGPTPTISGTPTVGSTLTANPGTWPEGATLTYQWVRLGAGNIPGATSRTYTLTSTDLGTNVAIRVFATAPGYASTQRTSAGTLIAAGPMSPAGTPTISGTARVGSTLTANPGTWPEGATLTYQWVRLGAGNIPGATSRTYTLTSTDLGTNVAIRVFATAPSYASTQRTSAGTLIAAAAGTASQS